MNVITKLMYSIHRILGTLLCILFLMWFLSAFVMMYHRFPRVSAKEKMQKLEMLSQNGDSLPDISSVTARLPHGVKVRSTMLNLNAGHPEFSFSTTKVRSISLLIPPSHDHLWTVSTCTGQQLCGVLLPLPVSTPSTLWTNGFPSLN